MNIKSKTDAADTETGWWVAALVLDREVQRINVHAGEAALLLAAHDPNKMSLDDACCIDTPWVSRTDMKRLRKEFDGQPPRPLGAWLAAARKAGLVVHPVVARVVDDAVAVAARDFARGAQPQSAAAQAALLQEPRQLRRSALVRELSGEWPSIEADLREASRNGLGAEAKAQRPMWRVDDAHAWAEAQGKLVRPAHLELLYLSGKRHKIK